MQQHQVHAAPPLVSHCAWVLGRLVAFSVTSFEGPDIWLRRHPFPRWHLLSSNGQWSYKARISPPPKLGRGSSHAGASFGARGWSVAEQRHLF